MPAFSARCAYVFVNNSINLLANRWTVNVRVDEIDATSFVDCGFVRFIPGPAMAEINVDGYYDSLANRPVHEAASNLKAGTEVVLKLYQNTFASPFWDFPVALITSVQGEAEVKGIKKYNFSARNQGVFTYPII